MIETGAYETGITGYFWDHPVVCVTDYFCGIMGYFSNRSGSLCYRLGYFLDHPVVCTTHKISRITGYVSIHPGSLLCRLVFCTGITGYFSGLTACSVVHTVLLNKVKMQYMQISNIKDASLKRPTAGQSTPMVKCCMPDMKILKN